MADICRWLARVLAILSALLVLVFAIGEPPSPGALSAREWTLLSLMLFALAGTVAAWRWEVAGAALALISTLVFTGVELVHRGRVPGPWLFGVMAAPALLYICSWLLRKRALAL